MAKEVKNKNVLHWLAEGKIVGIVGTSGCGKTTLLRMIAGLDNRYKGKIEGGGFKNVSFAFQEYRLFPELSTFDNIASASFDEITEE